MFHKNGFRNSNLPLVEYKDSNYENIYILKNHFQMQYKRDDGSTAMFILNSLIKIVKILRKYSHLNALSESLRMPSYWFDSI